jgi:hypothetical protein
MVAYTPCVVHHDSDPTNHYEHEKYPEKATSYSEVVGLGVASFGEVAWEVFSLGGFTMFRSK